MEEHFITYEQALALKELGFDEPCFGKYDTYVANSWVLNISPERHQFRNTNKACIAPLKQQVFKWFRDKYNLKSCIMFRTSMEDNKEYYDWLIKEQEVVYRHFKTYEEAESACIDKLIEIVKAK